ncbi:PLP-dependent aminotransferase family protein [Agromyces endophyticus]|uniref:MocR-like pyridoxine biosynthesis transcription factor PdxR n=1 Tax=Agromyces sp. H17E-10 TaxID=2932244 RepID=UPI001FD3CE4F|nr:PLP-dependent aminotransferase family protein [Agromyces sp. H17E-10]UOQ87857.1 PLP-dependent aminotransferase family protein [Agromyces sp. H17E-10]
MDLHLALDPRRKAASLEEALRAAVTDGRLAPGTRLPPTRTLAHDLGLARNSVAEVYARLVGEGRLEARVGSGTWVRDIPTPVPGARIDRSTRFDLDLRGGLPDASGFARSAWSRAVARSLAEAPGTSFAYGALEGTVELRTALAGYLARTRGVVAGSDDLVVTHGFGELLSTVARALAATGRRRIAVEAYGHASHREVLAAAGLEPVPVELDRDGMVVDRLETAGVDAVLVTPAHQFPTGVPLSAPRRSALGDWARANGAIVIEDDYDGEFRFDGRAIGAFQSLAPEHTVYGGTASKALAPGLGIGWGVVPAGLRDAVLEQRRLSGAATDAISQLALAAFIGAGDYDRAVRGARLRYRARRELLERLVAERLPDARIAGLEAGLHCLLELPPGIAEAEVVREAADLGLRYGGLASYAADGATAESRPPTMVVGYGAPPEHRFEHAIAAVIASIEAARTALGPRG